MELSIKNMEVGYLSYWRVYGCSLNRDKCPSLRNRRKPNQRPGMGYGKGRWEIASPTKRCTHLVNTNVAGFMKKIQNESNEKVDTAVTQWEWNPPKWGPPPTATLLCDKHYKWTKNTQTQISILTFFFFQDTKPHLLSWAFSYLKAKISLNSISSDTIKKEGGSSLFPGKTFFLRQRFAWDTTSWGMPNTTDVKKKEMY